MTVISHLQIVEVRLTCEGAFARLRGRHDLDLEILTQPGDLGISRRKERISLVEIGRRLREGSFRGGELDLGA